MPLRKISRVEPEIIVWLWRKNEGMEVYHGTVYQCMREKRIQNKMRKYI